MALKITRAADPVTVSRITACIYGAPGTGKTSVGFSAERPLLLDFDRGIHRAVGRGDAVQVGSWADVKAITADDLADYRTVIVDTAGRALDVLALDIMRRDAKMGTGGALSLQGYGRLKAEFSAWLKMLTGAGLDVVLLAHVEEQRKGDETIERIDAQGASKAEIYKSADLMGRLIVQGGKRVLTFAAADTAYAKAPPGIEAYPVPGAGALPGFLGRVLADTKAAINALSAKATELQQQVAAARAEFEALDAAGLSAKVAELAGADPMIRDALRAVAKGRGLRWDKEVGGFVAAAPDPLAGHAALPNPQKAPDPQTEAEVAP